MNRSCPNPSCHTNVKAGGGEPLLLFLLLLLNRLNNLQDLRHRWKKRRRRLVHTAQSTHGCPMPTSKRPPRIRPSRVACRWAKRLHPIAPCEARQILADRPNKTGDGRRLRPRKAVNVSNRPHPLSPLPICFYAFGQEKKKEGRGRAPSIPRLTSEIIPKVTHAVNVQ